MKVDEMVIEKLMVQSLIDGQRGPLQWARILDPGMIMIRQSLCTVTLTQRAVSGCLYCTVRFFVFLPFAKYGPVMEKT